MEKNKVYDVKYLNGRQILRPDTDGQSGSSVTPNPSTSPDDPRLTGLEVDGSKFKLDYATAEDVSGLSDKVEQDESEIESQGTRLTTAEETIVSQGNSINDNATAISNEVLNREAAITALANNVYAKADTYNKTEVDDMIAAIHQFEFEVVEELPEPTEEVFNAHKIYLVPKEGSGEDYYDEYVCVRDDQGFKFEKIGNTEVDLSNYYTKGETDAKFALANDLTALSGSLTTEVSRAQGVEASLQTAVENEASTARAAESANATAIANEATRAQAAEAANAGAVTAETNRAEAAEAGLQTAINNFVKANPEISGDEEDLERLEVNGVKYKVGDSWKTHIERVVENLANDLDKKEDYSIDEVSQEDSNTNLVNLKSLLENVADEDDKDLYNLFSNILRVLLDDQNASRLSNFISSYKLNNVMISFVNSRDQFSVLLGKGLIRAVDETHGTIEFRDLDDVVREIITFETVYVPGEDEGSGQTYVDFYYVPRDPHTATTHVVAFREVVQDSIPVGTLYFGVEENADDHNTYNIINLDGSGRVIFGVLDSTIIEGIPGNKKVDVKLVFNDGRIFSFCGVDENNLTLAFTMSGAIILVSQDNDGYAVGHLVVDHMLVSTMSIPLSQPDSLGVTVNALANSRGYSEFYLKTYSQSDVEDSVRNYNWSDLCHSQEMMSSAVENYRVPLLVSLITSDGGVIFRRISSHFYWTHDRDGDLISDAVVRIVGSGEDTNLNLSFKVTPLEFEEGNIPDDPYSWYDWKNGIYDISLDGSEPILGAQRAFILVRDKENSLRVYRNNESIEYETSESLLNIALHFNPDYLVYTSIEALGGPSDLLGLLVNFDHVNFESKTIVYSNDLCSLEVDANGNVTITPKSSGGESSVSYLNIPIYNYKEKDSRYYVDESVEIATLHIPVNEEGESIYHTWESLLENTQDINKGFSLNDKAVWIEYRGPGRYFVDRHNIGGTVCQVAILDLTDSTHNPWMLNMEDIQDVIGDFDPSVKPVDTHALVILAYDETSPE